MVKRLTWRLAAFSYKDHPFWISIPLYFLLFSKAYMYN